MKSTIRNLTVVSLPMVLFFVFGYHINHDFIRGDQLRWIIEVILPFSNGELSYFRAITFEYENFSHSHILTLAAYIFSFEYLRFDQSYNFYFGVGVYALTFLLLHHYIFNIKQQFSKLDFAFSFLLSFIFFNITFDLFRWSLLSFELASFGLAFLYFVIFDKLLSSKRYVYIVLVLPIFFVLGHSPSVGAILVCITYTALYSLVDKKSLLFLGYQLVALLCAAWLGEKLSWADFSHGEAVSNSLSDMVLFTLESISASLLNVEALSLPKSLSPFLFTAYLASLIISLALFVRYKMYATRNSIPILFLGFSFVGILGILLAREIEPSMAYGERYERYFIGLPIAIILIAYYYLKDHCVDFSSFIARALISFSLCIFFCQVLSNIIYFKRMDDYSAKEATRVNNFLSFETSIDYKGEPVCRRGFECERALIFLKERELSIFDKSLQDGK